MSTTVDKMFSYYTLFFYKNQYILFEAGCSYIFFIIDAEMFLICSYFPDWTLQYHKEECQTFVLFLSSRAHRQSQGGVLQKNRFSSCAKNTNQKIPAKEFNFSLLKLNSFKGIFHFKHRCSCILHRLAILKNTYSNIFAEHLQWLLLKITSL